MALSDLRQTKNKWALHAWEDHAIFVRMGDVDYCQSCILIETLYQTNPVKRISAVSIGSKFDKCGIICRKNIINWLRIFYPDLREVT